MKNGEIGICVIGAGRAGMIHAKAIAQLSGARVAALVDSDKQLCRDGCQRLGVEVSYQDYREALSEASINAVIVATPTKLHRDIVVAAADAGKHVLCEKPMAMNVSQCEEMIRAWIILTHTALARSIRLFLRFRPGHWPVGWKFVILRNMVVG